MCHPQIVYSYIEDCQARLRASPRIDVTRDIRDGLADGVVEAVTSGALALATLLRALVSADLVLLARSLAFLAI